MSLYDKASLVFSGKAAAGKSGKAYNIKPVEKLKVDEHVTNGGFDDDSSWVKVNSPTFSNGQVRFQASDGTNRKIYQTGVFEGDKTYKVSFDVVEIKKGEIRIGTGFNSVEITSVVNGGPISTPGSHSLIFKNKGRTDDDWIFFQPHTPSDPYDFTIDNVSVREVEQKAVDFTMVRGSNLTATREAPSGLIEKGRENLLQYSNNFIKWDVDIVDGVANGIDGYTITSGKAGYDGSNDATLVEKTGSNNNYIFTDINTVSHNGVFTYSIYARDGGDANSSIHLYVGDSSLKGNLKVNLNTGAILSGTRIHAVVDPITGSSGDTNRWYRVSFTNDANVNDKPRIQVRDNTGGSNTSGKAFIQNAQFEVGLVATPYIDTTDSYSKKTAGVLENEPRYDYSGGDATLLLEPERQNLIQHSEYFTFEGRTTITHNHNTSPEGLDNSTRFTNTTETGAHRTYSNGTFNVTSGDTYTVSVFAKKGSLKKLSFKLMASNEADIGFDEPIFNLDDGNIGGESSNASMVDYGNGWYRCIVTSSPTSTPSAARVYFYFRKDDDTKSYTGTTSQNMEIYGAQVEEGSYATSYIPTYGSAATRQQDGSTSSSTPMIQGEAFDLTGSFAVFLHLGKTQKTGGSSNALLRLATPGDIELNLYPNGSPGSIGLNLYLRNQGNYVFGTGANAGFEANESKVCVIYNASTNALAYYINGTVFGSETRELNFGDGSYGYIVGTTAGNGTTDFSAEVKQLIFFDKVVTPEEAVSLTTI